MATSVLSSSTVARTTTSTLFQEMFVLEHQKTAVYEKEKKAGILSSSVEKEKTASEGLVHRKLEGYRNERDEIEINRD